MLLFYIENPNLAAAVPMMLFCEAEECHVTIPSLMVVFIVRNPFPKILHIHVYVICLNDLQYLLTHMRIYSKFKHEI